LVARASARAVNIPPVATTWGDPRILRQIRREARHIGDPRARNVFLRSAVQVGLVESGGRNLSGGDADSAGWRQERASLYPNPTNVGQSVRRFRKEFQAIYRPGLKSYEAAARIQRPAAQYRGRYKDVAKTAARIVDRSGGTPGGANRPGGGVPGTSGLPGTVGAQNVAMGSTGALEAILALSQPKVAPGGSVPPLPAFAASAAPRLPQGYQGVQSGGAPEPPLDVDALLDQIRTPGGDVKLAPGAPGMPGADQVTGGFGSSATGRGRGRVVVDPNADRPGVKTSGAVVNFAREVSAIAGTPVRIGTGSRHSRLTVNGNVSDHWGGGAADIPASGRRLIRLGQAALIAAGMPAKQARKQTGGLYNVGGAQIIFNTQEGGDHTDHLHVRPPRKRRR